MKGIWKAIAYFVLYFGLTMILQVLLSIVFCAIGAANGLHDETLIMEFANNNILGRECSKVCVNLQTDVR